MDQEKEALPAGLATALGQHPAAMARFTAMTAAQRQEVVAGARAVQSKQEMQALVTGLENRMF